MISPKIEESRIRKALRDCKEHGFEVLEPMECIKSAIDKFGGSLAVACSFGSCSVVVLHMALQIKPNIKVVFNNTGVEYPETYAYRDLLKKEWNLNLIETKPIKSFWQCIKEYGFPLPRTRSKSQRISNPGKPKCCLMLKEYPMKKVCEEHGIEAQLTGLRVSESRARMFGIAQLGQIYKTKTKLAIWKYHPIAFWYYKDVWNYLKENNIPINQIYVKGADRSGCMPCTGFTIWQKQLAKLNPKLYRYVQHLRGVSLISDFLELENQAVESCSSREVQAILEEWF